jgi:hypothetical protein
MKTEKSRLMNVFLRQGLRPIEKKEAKWDKKLKERKTSKERNCGKI